MFLFSINYQNGQFYGGELQSFESTAINSFILPDIWQSSFREVTNLSENGFSLVILVSVIEITLQLLTVKYLKHDPEMINFNIAENIVVNVILNS